MYLDNCRTLEELKAAYRKYTKVLHPDAGGNTESMKRLNLEYETMFNKLKDQHNATADDDHKVTETAEEFINILEKLRNCSGLIIELCGSWLWISGNTYGNRDTLKAAGCKWSKSKSKWYWRHDENRNNHNRKSMSMDWIRTRYGSETISGLSPDPMLT